MDVILEEFPDLDVQVLSALSEQVDRKTPLASERKEFEDLFPTLAGPAARVHPAVGLIKNDHAGAFLDLPAVVEPLARDRVAAGAEIPAERRLRPYANLHELLERTDPAIAVGEELRTTGELHSVL